MWLQRGAYVHMMGLKYSCKNPIMYMKYSLTSILMCSTCLRLLWDDIYNNDTLFREQPCCCQGRRLLLLARLSICCYQGDFTLNSLWWRSQLHSRIIQVRSANPKPFVPFMVHSSIQPWCAFYCIVSNLYIYLINAPWFAL